MLLLTDDGDTIFKLTHPKFGKEKVYEVGLNKPLTTEDMTKINAGIQLEDGVSDLRVRKVNSSSRKPKMPNLYQVTMHEGRNRQIRRTFGGLRYMVTHLERVQFGSYTLTQLGTARYLQI